MNADLLKLKPCPFCSGGVTRWQSNGIGDKWLECADCGASTRLREDGAGSEKDWNRRATDTQALLDRISQLELEAKRYRYLRHKVRGVYGVDAKPAFVLPHVDVPPGVNIMRGSVAGHLDAAIDAALSAKKEST
jgi:hypothetical protein